MRDVREFGGQELREMLCFSIALWLRRLAKSAFKNGSCRGSAAQDVDEMCTTLWREGDLEFNILKLGMLRALFEDELCKICTTLWRESDLDIKIVKRWHARSIF